MVLIFDVKQNTLAKASGYLFKFWNSAKALLNYPAGLQL